jgi:hypothetical protein
MTAHVPFRRRAQLALLPLVLVAAAPAVSGRAQDVPALNASGQRLKADVTYLADDAREGRGPGLKGLDDAAQYIASRFADLKLKPVPGADGYFQHFTIPGDVRPEGGTKFAVKGPGGLAIEPKAFDKYVAMSIGGSGKVEAAPVVFAGYGITAKEDGGKLDYDDYAGIDVKDKVVLILRREPQQKDENSPFAGTSNTIYAAFRTKARNALDHGAAAVLLVNDVGGTAEAGDPLPPPGVSGGDGKGVPFLHVKREVGDALLKAAGAPSLAELETQIDADLKPVSRVLDGVTVDLDLTMTREPLKVKNVLGMIEGSGPLADETLIIGAHYDHVGRGGSGSLAPGSGDIHNGADDNASGTATVLELARRLSSRTEPLPRRVVFMLFSAEERGLLGSRYYVEHPLIPLDQTIAMLNFDMVGRLEADRKLTIYGGPSSPGFEELARSIASSQDILPTVVKSGPEMRFFEASDHASFYKKGIPVLFAFTGTHDDYHRPSDDSDKIDYDGMTKIANMGELLALDLALRPIRPEFEGPKPVVVSDPHAAPAASEPAEAPARAMAYLGTRPDYAAADIKGVLLEGVTPGSPAEKAGLKGGDVIVKFAGKTVLDVEDYMAGLQSHKAGEKVDVVVKRGDAETTIEVTLGSRSGAQ